MGSNHPDRCRFIHALRVGTTRAPSVHPYSPKFTGVHRYSPIPEKKICLITDPAVAERINTDGKQNLETLKSEICKKANENAKIKPD